MFDRPALIAGAALLLCAGLAVLVAARPLPLVTPGQAAAWAGADVRLMGTVTDARPWTDGTEWLTVAGDGHSIPVRSTLAAAPGAPPRAGDEAGGNDIAHRPLVGDRIVARGRLWRHDGELRLDATGPGALSVVPNPARQPSWSQVAHDPAAWRGVAIALVGRVDDGELHDGVGHRLRLGGGTWPSDGVVRAHGILSYDQACLCQRFHATDVQPWSS